MSNPEMDLELRSTARHVAELGRNVQIDPVHKAQLRAQLIERHHELSAYNSTSQEKWWSHFVSLKRLSLVGAPALALAATFSVLLWALQLSGHPSPQAAEAARITRALVRSVPTVTSWRVTVQQERGNAMVSSQCAVPAGYRIYIRDDQSFVYSGGRWYQLTGSWQRLAMSRLSAQCPVDFQWAFALLPNHLARQPSSILPRKKGDRFDRIHYSVAGSKGIHSELTAWINRKSGLLLRLNRVVMRGNSVVERDVAVYRYERTP